MSDPAIRLNAALKGHYAIERELGGGGMAYAASVYLADDLKHQRNDQVEPKFSKLGPDNYKGKLPC